MSQWLQNLLDRHQKTGMAATHASLTKRRKSPAPDVQLIQPQRPKKTHPKKEKSNNKKHTTTTHPPPPSWKKNQKNQEDCWTDTPILFELTNCQAQILKKTNKQKETKYFNITAFISTLSPHSSNPQLLTKMSMRQRDSIVNLHCYFTTYTSVPPSISYVQSKQTICINDKV